MYLLLNLFWVAVGFALFIWLFRRWYKSVFSVTMEESDQLFKQQVDSHCLCNACANLLDGFHCDRQGQEYPFCHVPDTVCAECPNNTPDGCIGSQYPTSNAPQL